MDLVPRLNQFLHSTPLEIETEKRLTKQLQEAVEFLRVLYREIRKSRPPSGFADAHEILRDLIHTYVADILGFIRQIEEILMSTEGTHELTLTFRITRADEFTSAFRQAWSKEMSRLDLQGES